MRKSRSSIVVLVALVSSLGFGQAPTPASAGENAEARALALINESRVEAGRSRVVRSAQLDQIAERHAMRMRAAGDIWHNQKLPRQISMSWSSVGENVGVGRTVRSLHRAYMASTGHRRNILAARWDLVGLGIVVSSSGRVYETQIFLER